MDDGNADKIMGVEEEGPERLGGGWDEGESFRLDKSEKW